jgi:acetyl esterase/lipase
MLWILLLTLLLLYGLTPKGSLLHEAIHLPWFWVSALSAPKHPTNCRKIYYGTHPRQYYLLCLPQKGGASRPELLFYFHGGSWRWGKPEFFKTHAGFFNKLGYAVVLPSYRPCPKHNYRHIKEDVEATLLHAYQLAGQEGLPCQQAITGGMSAGGHLACQLALQFDSAAAGLPAAWIKKSFALGAPLHLAAMPESFVLKDLAGQRQGDLFKQTDPFNHAHARLDCPILVVHGTHDGMVPYHSTKGFAQRREEANPAAVEWKSIYKGTHLSIASWIFKKGATRQAVLQWLCPSDS